MAEHHSELDTTQHAGWGAPRRKKQPARLVAKAGQKRRVKQEWESGISVTTRRKKGRCRNTFKLTNVTILHCFNRIRETLSSLRQFPKKV
jgi:hypothetical protein